MIITIGWVYMPYKEVIYKCEPCMEDWKCRFPSIRTMEFGIILLFYNFTFGFVDYKNLW
jgi:hypothetical protein